MKCLTSAYFEFKMKEEITIDENFSSCKKSPRLQR